MRFKMLALATASLLTVSIPFAAEAAKPVLGDWGYDKSAMDSSVKPGDDFWAYVNGSWDQRTQIPGDHPSVGSFITLRDGSERDVRQIAEAFANKSSGDQVGRQIGDYYSTFMDEGAIEGAGTAPLRPSSSSWTVLELIELGSIGLVKVMLMVCGVWLAPDLPPTA